MAVPTGKSETCGALLVAVGLILGGSLSYICGRYEVPTPGLLLRRPSVQDISGVLGEPCDDGSAAACAREEPPVSCEKLAAQGDLRPHDLVGSHATSAPLPDAATSKPRGQRLQPIEINSATQDELMQVDGIGPVLAGRILEFRKRNGPFHRMEDLLKVKGIGPATLARIKATAKLGEATERDQKTLRTSTSSHADSSSFHR